jgi:hypothetical protein
LALVEGGNSRATTVETDTTNFDTILSSADDTVQKALDTIDDGGVPIVGKVAVVGGITIGQAVCITGATGDKPKVELADNTVHDCAHTLGIAMETKANNQNIRVMRLGFIENVDTSAFNESDRMHLLENGEMQAAVSISGAHIHMGWVTKSDASEGIMLVKPSDYVHDVRGTPDLDIEIATGSNDATRRVKFENYSREELGYFDGAGSFVWSGAAVFNEIGGDNDFRVEASGVANAFFVQGSDGLIGINESAPDAMLEIVSNNATEECLHLKGAVSQSGELLLATDSSDNMLARIMSDGCLQTPCIGIGTTPTPNFVGLIMNQTFSADASHQNINTTLTQSAATTGLQAAAITIAKSTHTSGTMSTLLGYFGGANAASDSAVTSVIGIDGTGEVTDTKTPNILILEGIRGETKARDSTTTIAISIHGFEPTVETGSIAQSFAGLFEGDVQISSDKKLILEGSFGTKGDSYLVFNSATTDIDLFVDNTKVQTWDNDESVIHKKLTIGSGEAGVDYTLTFDGETNDGVITWMEDEDYFEFKDDLYLSGGEYLIFDKASGNGIKIDNATPTFGWGDLIGEIRTRGVGATDPNDATYRGNIKAFQFAVDDVAWMNFHMPHDYVSGTDIYLHFHWSHIGTQVTGGTVNFVYELSNAKGHNQAAFSAPISGSLVGTASTTQYQHIISEAQLSAASPSGSQIGNSDLEIDGLIMMRIKLQDNDITVSGGGVPDPFIHYVDIHYQSTGIGTKDKAPDFYS